MDKIMRDKFFDFAYEMAFRDATMRRAFPKTGDGDESYDNRKMESKGIAKDKVKNYIDAIFDDNKESPDVKKTIEEISIATEGYGFSFGNAQKLVNMTAKYMYLCIYGMGEADRERYRKKFENCHCPMDGVMISSLAETLKEKHPEIKWNKVAWSTQSLDDHKAYDAFQDSVTQLAKANGWNAIEIDYYYYY